MHLRPPTCATPITRSPRFLLVVVPSLLFFPALMVLFVVRVVPSHDSVDWKDNPGDLLRPRRYRPVPRHASEGSLLASGAGTRQWCVDHVRHVLRHRRIYDASLASCSVRSGEITRCLARMIGVAGLVGNVVHERFVLSWNGRGIRLTADLRLRSVTRRDATFETNRSGFVIRKRRTRVGRCQDLERRRPSRALDHQWVSVRRPVR